MKKKNFKTAVLFFGLFCLSKSDSFAANKNSEQYLQSRIEILEQKIKLLQREQDFTHAKLEEYVKNNNISHNANSQNSDDIRFHSENENQSNNNNDIKFNNSDVKIEQVESNNNLANENQNNTIQAQTELVLDQGELVDLYNSAVEQVRLKDYELSSSMLKKITSVKVDESSDSDTKEIVANAHYLIGELSLKTKNYEQASSHFLSAYNFFVKNNSKNIQGANSLFQLAKSLHLMDKKDGACNSLKKINAEFTKLPDNLKNKIDIEVTNLHCN